MRLRLLLLALLVVPVACGDDGDGDDEVGPSTTSAPAPTTTVPDVPAAFGADPEPVVIGHRGGADGELPDNSLDAFATARDRDATWVELDVRLSADGDVVLSHDPETVEGLVVATTPTAELGLPTLVEALDVIDEQHLGVNVEIKSDPTEEHYDPQRGVVDATMAVLEARPPQGPVVVSSFDRGAIDRVEELTGDDFPTALLAAGIGDVAELATGLVAGGHEGIVLEQDAATAEAVGPLADEGLVVWAYTVDEPDRAVELVANGVTGIITDAPAEIAAALG